MVANRTEEEKKYLLDAIDAFNRKIIIISTDHTILAANATALQSNPRESLIGRTCYKALLGWDRPCLHCPADEVRRTGEASLRYDHIDNSFNFDENLCLFSYPVIQGDEVEFMVMLDFDLPALKHMEEKRLESNAFLRNLLNSAVDAVIAADTKGRILIFNEAAEQITGYTKEEAMNEITIRDVYPGDGAREVMRMLLSEEYGGVGKLKSYHINGQHKNGEIIPISLNASIVYDANGEQVATIGFFHDRRDEIRMQKELEKTQVQLLQAEKMASLGKMAAGVAHQLNNPLSGIILYTKLVMEEYDLPPEAMEDLKRVLDDSERAKETVKELLEFARQTSQEMQPQDINEIVSRTIFLLENQSIFHNIKIEESLAENLPLVSGDVQQLNHVIMNIVLNAADAMEGSGILSIRTRYSAQNQTVRVSIADTGPGIPEDVLPHIFEPFYTTKDQGKGTGLGLSMVYGILESHGGKIWAESEVGKGATFHIELPAAEMDESEDKIG
ncbi:MAG: two-component system sensor histidine kinase NtrB [Desulfobacterales bacterium]